MCWLLRQAPRSAFPLTGLCARCGRRGRARLRDIGTFPRSVPCSISPDQLTDNTWVGTLCLRALCRSETAPGLKGILRPGSRRQQRISMVGATARSGSCSVILRRMIDPREWATVLRLTFPAKGPLGDMLQDARMHDSLIHAAVKAGQPLHEILHPLLVKVVGCVLR